MRYSRPAALAAATIAAAALTAPAFASAPTSKPTSLNLRAIHGVVRVHHTDTFTATLSSAGKGVAGEAANLVVQERRAVTSGHTRAWQNVTPPVAITDLGSGRYSFKLTPWSPPISKNTQRDQFRVKFLGDAAKHYNASHSQVITITVTRLTS